MVGINRRQVQHSFDRHATQYERNVLVQKRVVDRFTKLLRARTIDPRRVLDLGSGTGMLLRNLMGLYPASELIGLDLAFGMSQIARTNLAAYSSVAFLNCDAETLPFLDNSFELVVSTSTFQWLESLDRVFSEAYRVLAPGGLFAFALFGERTLFELRTSYRNAWQRAGRGSEERTHSFHRLSEVEATLGRVGFSDVQSSSELEIDWYTDVPELLRAVRRIGAGSTAPVKSQGLAERRVMLDMMAIYCRDYAADGRIPATYEVIYGTGMKWIS